MMKKYISFLIAGAVLFSFQSCSDDDNPPVENIEEEITQVILTFTNTQDASDVVVAEWLDADGEGGGAPVIDDITLSANMNYELTIEFFNTLESPAEDITTEVAEEDDEHMIFFAFTTDIFQDPAGNGNADNRSDALNYNDQDENGYPLGLSTDWVTSADAATGDFRIILKHQPDIKTATSTSADGETDVDVTFNLSIQ